MKKMQSKKRKGFTLVELIVVIALLAILSVGAIIGYGRVRDSAEDAIERANAAVIVRSLNTYNALVTSGTRIEGATDGDPATTAQVGNLNLTAANGIIAIDLSIDATADEIAAALPFTSWDDTAGKWVVATP